IHTTEAFLNRSVTATGTVSVQALGSSNSGAEANASTSGAPKKGDGDWNSSTAYHRGDSVKDGTDGKYYEVKSTAAATCGSGEPSECAAVGTAPHSNATDWKPSSADSSGKNTTQKLDEQLGFLNKTSSGNTGKDTGQTETPKASS